jgi:hypothetical protein
MQWAKAFRSGGPLRSLTDTIGRPAARHRGTGHPLLGSACPPEFSPSRVAGHRFPAPPLPLALSRRAPGSFPVRPPGAPRSTGALSWAWPPSRVFNRPHRPARRPAPPVGFFAPTTTVRPQVRLTRVCLTRHLPASGFRPSRRFAPCARPPVRGPEAVRGVHPSGLDTFKPAAPVSGPLPSCRFRLSLSSPLRTRR